jgi:hypothetical protein
MQWQKHERSPARLGINVEVDAVCMSKLWLWTDMARGEVSALGMVEEIRDSQTGVIASLRVTDVYLIKQVSTDAETELDPKAVAELMLELEQAGQDVSKLRFWWHSHGSLSVFWSDQDESCVADLANGEYLLALVVNKRRESLCRLDQFHPTHMYLSDVVWEVYYPLPEGLSDACSAEFRNKVTEGSLLSRWKVNGRAKEQIEELQAARERGVINEDELREELGMITYGDMDWGSEDDVPF